MHLALISGILAFLLKKPLGTRFAALFGALVLILYTFLVGPQPSLVRALIMYGLGVLCLWGNFPRNPLSLLGIAFLIQLMIDPASGRTPSFLLSYTGLGGLLLFREPIEHILRGRLPEPVLKPLAASLGAFLGTMGISAFFFGTIYPIGILAGLIVVPLTSLFMIVLILVLPLLAIPGVSGPIGNLLSVFYTILSKLVAGAGQVPGIPIANPVPLWIITAVLAFLLIGFGNWYGARRNYIAPFASA
jgi:competence protein ComEC